jgi:hypothetical protein
VVGRCRVEGRSGVDGGCGVEAAEAGRFRWVPI